MHKPLPVLRSEPVDGDEAGLVDNAAAGMAPSGFRKRDIPTPVIAPVSGYEMEQKAGYKVPDGYIRYPRRAAGEDDMAVNDYCLEAEDEEWLERHPRYGLAGLPSEREKLGVDRLERMLGILERATGQADLVPMPQAETLFVSQLGMSKAQHHEAWVGVYRYWKEKRSKLGKPLLRRFWPVTSPSDTDPHKVFRPREKERYKLRKHRKNDMDSFRKLQQVKKDFEKLLNITRMIQKREMMKREQLLVRREIFLQQHWDLTDTTGEARPLGIRPGTYRPRPRQFASGVAGAPGAAAAATAGAAAQATGAAASGGASVAGSAGGGLLAGVSSSVSQPFERVRDDRERERSSRKTNKKRKDRPSASTRDAVAEREAEAASAGAAALGSGSSGAGVAAAVAAGGRGFVEGGDVGDTVSGAGAQGGSSRTAAVGSSGGGGNAAGTGASGGEDPAAAAAAGLIPGSHISVLPSFMDELKTRSSIPVRTVVEPSLAVYSVRGGIGATEGAGGGRRVRARTKLDGARKPGGGVAGAEAGASAAGSGGGGGKGAQGGRGLVVGVEPVYNFRLRGRIGRGGRVIWDRVPVRGGQPPRDDGLTDPDDSALVVHSNYVRFQTSPPSACTLHPPMVNLKVDERRYREICAMDDDQEEVLEPLGLGLVGETPNASGASSSSDALGGGSKTGGTSLRIKYAIEV